MLFRSEGVTLLTNPSRTNPYTGDAGAVGASPNPYITAAAPGNSYVTPTPGNPYVTPTPNPGAATPTTSSNPTAGEPLVVVIPHLHIQSE